MGQTQVGNTEYLKDWKWYKVCNLQIISLYCFNADLYIFIVCIYQALVFSSAENVTASNNQTVFKVNGLVT